MSIARDPNGVETCLHVDANGSLLTFAGTMTREQRAEQATASLILGEMRMFGVDPGSPWVKADGHNVTVRGKKYELPDMQYYYVYLPEE